ncbi:tetranectin [Eucyclogobius newberryi]|uniref:tetranectin n=1 Tax=Eucyclogobius newberryi TaxID=166745 RepID=UPI003B5B0820
MDARAALVVVFLLVLGQSAQQETTSKRRNRNKGADSAAMEEMKNQISNIMMELNVIKEQQALQTVCLRGMKILGKCFLADGVKKNFHSASDDCIAKGGALAAPLSLDENEQLHNYVRQSIGPEEHIWIGINDMVTEGVWSQNTGTVLRYANWETEITHQPDGATRQNCGALSTRAKGKWFDENCKEEKASVCEFNIV